MASRGDEASKLTVVSASTQSGARVGAVAVADAVAVAGAIGVAQRATRDSRLATCGWRGKASTQ